MRRRSFCRSLALLPLGILLAACNRTPVLLPVLPAAAGEALRGKDKGALIARLLATSWADETPQGFTAGYSIRELDPADTTAVTVAFYPDFHRVSYAVFASPEEAEQRYTAGAAALRADPQGQVNGAPTDPYPNTTLFYGTTGHGLVLIGPLLVRVIVASSNPDDFNALVSASVVHLARALNGGTHKITKS